MENLNDNNKDRDERGRFERRCGSLIHAEEENPSLYLIDLRKRKKISSADAEKLLNFNVVNSDTRYICKACLEAAKRNWKLNQNDKPKPPPQEDDSLFQECVRIGETLNKLMKNDLADIKESKLKTIETVNNFNLKHWLSNRPKELIFLLCSICKVDINTASVSKVQLIAKAVELLYYSMNSKLVLPSHFFENLLCYSLTNCKSYINFLGNRSPGGAYTFLCNWLKEQSKDPLKFPEGLVKSVFDNNQKVGKTYLISETNIVPTSVITSHLWIIFDPTSKMQEKSSLKPCAWMQKELDDSQTDELIRSLTVPTENFRLTRNSHITKCLEIVVNQFHNSDADIIDLINEEEAELSSQKRCLVCGMESDAAYRVCRNADCGGRVVTEKRERKENSCQNNVNPYDSFENALTSLPNISCQAGEPDFINPNGYHNIIQVIKAIGVRAGMLYCLIYTYIFNNYLSYSIIKSYLVIENSVGFTHNFQ